MSPSSFFINNQKVIKPQSAIPLQNHTLLSWLKPLHFMPNWSNYIKGIFSLCLSDMWFLLDLAAQLIKSSFFNAVVDLGTSSNILSFQNSLSVQPEVSAAPTTVLCSSMLPCNQRPLLLNYGVWIWALWWPSPSDPTTDPSIRAQPSHHCFVGCIAFFFFICRIFMKREMKESGSLVLCSHIYTLQRLWTGALCLLCFYVGYTLSSRVGGQEASLSCR